MTAGEGFKKVCLVGVPLDLWDRGRSWFEGLLREFDIVASDTGERTPRELLDFVAEARQEFGEFTIASRSQLTEAYRRGEATADVELELPAEAKTMAKELMSQIRKAEEYCRRGDLLTLMPDEELRRYLDWYIGEVTSQLEGAKPEPWEPEGVSG